MSEITDYEKCVKIAKACGKDEPSIFRWELPDYLNDLNAMHEAEKVLTPSDFRRYADLLCDMVDPGDPDPNIEGLIRLTATLRAEAFGMTLNL